MLKVIIELFSLLTPSQRKRFYVLQVLILIMTFIEILSIASIVPFMTLVADPSVLERDNLLATVYLKYNFESFQNKHSESLFTRFYEGYWLPTRFNIDTRRLTFSSQILTDQMTREDALENIQVPALSQHEVNELYDFVAKKLRIPLKELQNYQTMKLKSFSDYKNQALLYNIASMLFKIFKGDISGAKR